MKNKGYYYLREATDGSIFFDMPARLRFHKHYLPNERQQIITRFSLLLPAESGHNLRCLFCRFLGKSSGSKSQEGDTVSDQHGILPGADTAEGTGRRQGHEESGTVI